MSYLLILLAGLLLSSPVLLLAGIGRILTVRADRKQAAYNRANLASLIR